MLWVCFFFSSRSRHTRCALVTGVQTCALPILRTATTAPEREWLAKLLNDGGISHLIRAGGVRGMVAPITLLRHLRAGYRRHPDVDLYHINWLQTALPLPDDGKPVQIGRASCRERVCQYV